MDTVRGRRGWDEWREQCGNMYITICKIDRQWGFVVLLRELKDGEDVEKREPSYTICGNVNQFSYYKEVCGGSLGN